ncbi:DUF5709 domain-containing protein [Streptomyces sp. C11-1]|uniref:DUF5709 domain-containing protein n=1 Tax=Streptomyces durocortorensis TaxID=2811104 RepID=A0ABY9W3N0_9ACTN|nr:DUF5709 domain-containing protein [Streptomyces durocortorensis]WNF30759.1 DUF5709 domain-containing protein [Streptomyces durocortorensis]
MSDTDWGDDVYQPQEQPEASDPDEQLGAEDTLMDPSGTGDPLDEGYSPPDRPWAVEGRGTTAAEGLTGESLEARLTRELPEPDGFPGDGVGDLVGGDGELWDGEVGVVRAGRLTQQADGSVPATLTASDVGIDGAAASAEEAAMHVIPDPAEEDSLIDGDALPGPSGTASSPSP